ncbi:hypothetical protein GY45DRAFT_1340572 [Cubamyces sp. BRFM 1775]|nr:hypothetical protein GY45DRAFT_1340572 [Cubamyces sp. BRFM 1775]
MGRLRQGKASKKAGATARQLRAKLRKIMKASLVRLTKDKTAKMWWTMHAYHQYVYMRRRARLVGWPSDVRFADLSTLKKPTLETLHRRWRRRALRFERITEAEAFANSRHPERVVPGAECDEGICHQGRDDIKKSRFDKETGLPVSSRRKLRLKGATSNKLVETSE